MTDAIQAAAWRIAILADGGLDGTVALKDAGVVARAYLGMLAFRAGANSSGEKAGLTQASDSLARISSSHPEDGGIREALEAMYQACLSGDFYADYDEASHLLGIARVALNPAPLPIGEEK